MDLILSVNSVGNAPGAPLFAVAATMFSRAKPGHDPLASRRVCPVFHRTISLSDGLRQGLVLDPEGLDCWARHPSGSRLLAASFESTTSVRAALLDLRTFIEDQQIVLNSSVCTVWPVQPWAWSVICAAAKYTGLSEASFEPPSWQALDLRTVVDLSDNFGAAGHLEVGPELMFTSAKDAALLAANYLMAVYGRQVGRRAAA